MTNSYDGPALADALHRAHHRTARDEALLRQALEALEAMNPYPASKEDQRANAIAALRERLGEKT